MQTDAAAAVSIRRATLDDLSRLTEIYNHYIRTTPITFDLEPWTVEQRHKLWWSKFAESGRHQIFVAAVGTEVLGFAGTTGFRDKKAYDTTVEPTIYLDPDATGRGLGSRLYATLFEAIAGEDIRMAVAGITVPNEASVALHERFGFTLAGVMHEVGRKFGKYWDVAWYEKPMG